MVDNTVGSLKVYCTVLSNWLLHDGGKHCELVSSMSMGSIFGYEVSSLVRSNVFYNTMMTGKAFSKSIDSNLRRSIIAIREN